MLINRCRQNLNISRIYH